MDLVTGALGKLPSKLLQLLNEEYKLQKGVRAQVEFLSRELESMHATLRKVAAVPWDQLDEQVKVWAREVREASYDMEDVIDIFLVGVEVHEPTYPSRLKRAMKKMGNLFSKCKTRHSIALAIEDIKKQLMEVSERRARYKVDEIVAKPVAMASTIDPRLAAMYNEVKQLIGIDKSRGELISFLCLCQGNGDESDKKMKTVSIVGVGGLGKTTLAKAVYDELKPQFGCGAFVPVGRNPDLKKVLRDILIDFDKEYIDPRMTLLDERQLINEIQHFLKTKRYFVVIDDIWETQSWEIVKLALIENNCGSRIITTTRKLDVVSSEVYRLQPLSYHNSQRLFYSRIFGSEGKCPDNLSDVSEKILKKCDGVPLAIITMASLLVGKSRDEWSEVYSSIALGYKDNRQVESTMKILSFSYYDLPSHLKNCLLYLSVFPEEYVIDKVSLIWKWVAEDFVHRKQGIGLFEVGEGYFNDLINRSMIQAVESDVIGIVYGCRVHDMVLDLLRSLSLEENFVKVFDNNAGMSSGHVVRRLAYQNRIGGEYTYLVNQMDLRRVRSFISYRSMWIGLPCFKLLRVLLVERCMKNGSYYSLEHIGNLIHLRYLGIKHMYIRELPKEIGSLKILETLDLKETGIQELPSSVSLLTKLTCLRAWRIRIPNGIIEKLKSLEELQIYPAEDENSKGKFFKDICSLGELRVLRTAIFGMGESMVLDFLQSLCSLNKLEHLTLVGWSRARDDRGTWDAAVLPQRLRSLILDDINFSRLPSCVNPTHLPNLSHLDLFVAAMDEQALELLGRLPGLSYLELSTWSTSTLISTNIAFGGFQKLRSCSLNLSMVQFVLNEDSSVSFTMWNGVGPMAFGSKIKDQCIVALVPIMPNLEELEFVVPMMSLMERNGTCDNLGLELLKSLQKITVHLLCEGDLPVHEKEVEADTALRHAADIHPNRPTITISYSAKTKRYWPGTRVEYFQ